MDIGEVGWGDVDWIGLAQDRNRPVTGIALLYGDGMCFL
jgi:hypothetical protein